MHITKKNDDGRLNIGLDTFRLERADAGGGMQYLPVKVGRLDSIAVDDAQGAYASAGEIGGSRASEATGADE